MRHYILAETNYAYTKANPYEVAVLPLGATEPHNLHLPYGTDLFEGLESPLSVMRYHSLVIQPESLPAELEVVARAVDAPDEIHAVRHRTHPVWGVQFHPESVLTPQGKIMLRNFLELAACRA